MFARALICVRGRLSRQPQELGGWGWELRAGGYRAGRGGGGGGGVVCAPDSTIHFAER